MRLIDADALKEKIKGVLGIRSLDYLLPTEKTIVNQIDQMPTIEPQRNTGRWIKKMRINETEKYTSYDPDWYCACCGAKYDPHIARMVNFCYVCGADMRGAKDG